MCTIYLEKDLISAGKSWFTMLDLRLDCSNLWQGCFCSFKMKGLIEFVNKVNWIVDMAVNLNISAIVLLFYKFY